jgi:hypothetical protein
MLMPAQAAFILGVSPVFPLPSRGDRGFELAAAIMLRGGSRDEAEAALQAALSPLAKR